MYLNLYNYFIFIIKRLLINYHFYKYTTSLLSLSLLHHCNLKAYFKFKVDNVKFYVWFTLRCT